MVGLRQTPTNPTGARGRGLDRLERSIRADPGERRDRGTGIESRGHE
ncbi:hypothetical protein [Natrinema salaciae]|nr:hypothetical protein [Natrinema salaciae]